MQIKKVFSKILAASLASALLISCVSAAAPQKTLSDAVSNKGKVTTTASATTGKKPKYVFMFIGDGMSYPQFQAASDYLGAVADQDNDDILDGNKPLNFMNFPVAGSAVTYDSTGHKTYSGTINMDETMTVKYETIAEKLHDKGYDIGVVSSVNLNHATPAAFYCHQPSRSNYYAIGEEMVASDFDYFAGGALLDPQGKEGDQESIYDKAEKAGYKVVKTQAEAEKVSAKDEKVVIIGEKLADSDSISYENDRASGEWALADYVSKGIEVLSDNDKGFFMMVEGGKIDWACHANDAGSTINDTIDFDTAAIIAEEMGCKVEKEVTVTIEEQIIDDHVDTAEELETRAPVVVVMGHVDHGKTSLLDAIRKTSVTAEEAGGITQHIGAYTVDVNGNMVTFLDTPGHAAFTSMRARGAKSTDIAILVVAADDGIMPQTIESINHAKAADVPIIVAINKMDKPTANPDKIKEQLTKYDLIPEEWGGETVICPISAKTGQGLDNLLEMVILTAEVLELKANPNRRAKGVVIEARLDKSRGPVATLLVQNGTLKQGDIVIAGTAVGRVRVMTNDKGRTVKTAGPSVPVEITGLADVPTPGDEFNAVTDERMARELVEQRRQAQKDALAKMNQKVTLDNLFAKMQEGEMKELPLIVKADVQGSAEALKSSLEKISNEEVRVRVIHAGVGAINESDILLASTAGAIVVGFNVRPDAAAAASAHRANVDMRFYRVIYDAIDEIEAAMKGMLAPKFEEVVIGHAEVRMTYKVSAIGTIAGCMVKDGKVTRDSQVRVLRDNIVIHEGEIGSLQRFKDAVKEVTAGYECGMSVVKYNDIKEGDIFECFVMQEVKR